MGLIDQIISVESGGDPNAKNPMSSASGPSQFIDSTWLSMMAKHRPDITGSPQDLLALKSDPELSKAMTEAYAADNGQILSKAGVPVTPGTTYLAHFAGPQGAVSVLSADPNAPVSSILTPGAVKANPFLQNMTAGDLQAWADRKMGGKAGSPSAPASPPGGLLAQPAQSGMPLNIAPQAPPIFSAPQAQPQQAAPSYFAQMPAEQMAAPPPIFTPPRRAVDLSKLKAALASGNRGLFFSKG